MENVTYTDRLNVTPRSLGEVQLGVSSLQAMINELQSSFSDLEDLLKPVIRNIPDGPTLTNSVAYGQERAPSETILGAAFGEELLRLNSFNRRINALTNNLSL